MRDFDFLNWDLYPFLLMWDVHEDDMKDDDSDDDTETEETGRGPSSGCWMEGAMNQNLQDL